jgi:hypothetical protein
VGGGRISGPPGRFWYSEYLKLRVHRFGKLHFEVLVSEVEYLHIQQNGVCTLLTLSQSSLGCSITIRTTLEVPVLFDSLRLNLRPTETLSCHFDLAGTVRNLGLFTLAWIKCEIYSLTGSFTNHYISYESNRSRVTVE